MGRHALECLRKLYTAAADTSNAWTLSVIQITGNRVDWDGRTRFLK